MKKIFTILSAMLFAAGVYAATEQAWYNDVTSIANGGQYYIYSVNGNGFMQAGQAQVKSITTSNYTNASTFKFTIANPSEGTVKSGNYYLKCYKEVSGTSSGPLVTSTGNGTNIIFTSMSNGSYWNIHGHYNVFGQRYPALFYKDGQYDGYISGSGLSYSTTKDVQTAKEYQWYVVSQAQLDRHFAIYFFDAYKETLNITQYSGLVPAAYYTALENAYNQTFSVQNTEHTADVVNAAKANLETLYNGAADIAAAYAMAKGAISTLEAVEDKGEDYSEVTTDINNAKTALEQAMTVAAINASVANLKAIDPITFNTTTFTALEALGNPASTAAGRTITYSAADKTIINAAGQPIHAGTTTLTATAAATSEYYKFVRSAQVTVNALPTTADEYLTITYGEAANWHGNDLSVLAVGSHNLTFVTTNEQGGVHTITLHLTVIKQDVVTVPVDLEFCEGDSVEYRGTTYKTAGFYPVYAEGEVSDTVYNVTVIVNLPTYYADTITKVYGEPLTWIGNDLSGYEVGVHELRYEGTNGKGCDSIITLVLRVEKMETLSLQEPLGFCVGDSVEFRGKWYKEAVSEVLYFEGDVRDTIISVEAVVYPTEYTVTNDTILSGHDVILPEGEWVIGEDTVSGTYSTIQSADSTVLTFYQYDQTNDGCEAVIELNVALMPNHEAIDNVFVGEKAEKIFRNGVLYIRRGEGLYTSEGKRVE